MTDHHSTFCSSAKTSSKKSGDDVFVELAQECDNLMSELATGGTPTHSIGSSKICRSAKRCVRFGSCGDESGNNSKAKRDDSSVVCSPHCQHTLDTADNHDCRSTTNRGSLSDNGHSEATAENINKECSNRTTGKSKPNVQLTLPVSSSPGARKPLSSTGTSPPDSQSSGPSTGPGRASPLSGLGDILDWLRPRAFSDHIKNRRRSTGADTAISSMSSSGTGSSNVTTSIGMVTASHANHRFSLSNTRQKSSNGCNTQTTPTVIRSPVYRSPFSGDEGFASSEDVHKPLYVDTRMANDWINSLPPPLDEFCARRSMSISSDPFVLSKKIAAAGNVALAHQRQRRNSEFGRYFIMRRSRDLGGINEFVAQLEDNGEQAYCQLLCSMKCYDVMPTMSKVIVLDSALPVSKGFAALVRNDAGAVMILESSTSTIIGILTVTDLLNTIAGLRDVVDPAEVLNAPIFTRLKLDEACDENSLYGQQPATLTTHGTITGKPVSVFSDYNLYIVSKLLCERRIHRVVVYDSEYDVDPLFMISKRMILKALHKYIARLPMPACMHSSLEELRLGTWQNLLTVNTTTEVSECLAKLTSGNVSCLPVVKEVGAESKSGPRILLNVLTKQDFLDLIVDEYGTAKYDVNDFLSKTVAEVLSCKAQKGPGKLFTCHKRITLMLAVESMLHAGAHRLIVVDSTGYLEAVVSVSDLMRFLIAS